MKSIAAVFILGLLAFSSGAVAQVPTQDYFYLDVECTGTVPRIVLEVGIAEPRTFPVAAFKVYRRSLSNCGSRELATPTPIPVPAPGTHFIEFDDVVDAASEMFIYELIAVDANGQPLYSFEDCVGGVLKELSACNPSPVQVFEGGIPPTSSVLGYTGDPCPSSCADLIITKSGPLETAPGPGDFLVYGESALCGFEGCFVSPASVAPTESCQAVQTGTSSWSSLKSRF